MRAAASLIALCAAGASALPSPAEVETRQSAGTWHLIGFQPNCGSFGCNADYAIFGGANSVPGAPAFGVRV
ncbi:hypothetical protein SAMD00023353_7000030 [Rosellinia necatrix]|uniref:Uncharacterized protein n=1 Tax=Rosellinia necatrix TaxID=77044 RepID=A0A1S8AAJ5_ROSNE|nr:hypothetical protein SAMD00023353_7000030 [Rosellinia necatrix]